MSEEKATEQPTKASEHPSTSDQKSGQKETPEVKEVPVRSTGWVACPICKEVVKAMGKYAHWMNNHDDIDYHQYKDQWKVAPIPEGERGGPDKAAPPSDVEARNFVITTILSRLENEVYGVGSKKAKFIARTLKNNPEIALNQTALYWHIKQIARKANNYQLMLFVRGVFNELQEEGLLQGIQPFYPGMPGGGQNQQKLPFMTQPMSQSQQPFFNPFQPPQQQQPQQPQNFQQQQEWRTARKREHWDEEEHALRMEKLKAEIQRLTQGPQEKQGSSDIVEITEPIRDEEGNLVRDEETGKPILRRVKGPADRLRGGRKQDPEQMVLTRLAKYKELGLLGSDLTEEQVRNIVRAEVPRTESEPLTEEKVTDITTKAATTILAKAEKEDKEERRHRELLRAVKSGRSSQVMEGYQSDEYRFMGQGLDKLADVIEHKEPVRLIVDLVKETPRAGSKQVEEGAREGIFDRVSEKYVEVE